MTGALDALSGLFDELRAGGLYRSRPRSPIPQPAYLNTAAVGRSGLPPEALLAVLKALEQAGGRRAGARLGPRFLDLDLLLYDDQQRDDPELTLPHPRLAQRRFVLAPLAEVAPAWIVPRTGRSVEQLLAAVGQYSELTRIADAGWWTAAR